jgi:hypothetical protein
MLKSSSLRLYSSILGTIWLKIEQFWPFEEISIFSNGGHRVVLFQNSVQHFRKPTKMAAKTNLI